MERRKHLRYQFQCEIWLPWKEESVAGTVSNLAVGGCKVKSEASVYIGMYLALQICLPGQEATLKVDLAVVRWATGWEFGAEFMRLRTEERERLQRLVTSLEKGSPPEE